MKLVDRGEILGLAEYETVRERFRARVIAEKKLRRVQLGPKATAVFENHDTVLMQVQEMLRTERITRPAAVQHEIDTYNELVPGRGRALVHRDDRDRRTRTSATRSCRRRVGFEKHVSLVAGGERIAARAMDRGTSAGPDDGRALPQVHPAAGSPRAATLGRAPGARARGRPSRVRRARRSSARDRSVPRRRSLRGLAARHARRAPSGRVPRRPRPGTSRRRPRATRATRDGLLGRLHRVTGGGRGLAQALRQVDAAGAEPPHVEDHDERVEEERHARPLRRRQPAVARVAATFALRDAQEVHGEPHRRVREARRDDVRADGRGAAATSARSKSPG